MPKTTASHFARINGFKIYIHLTNDGFKWADSGEQCDSCGHTEFDRMGDTLACAKCGAEYAIFPTAIPATTTTSTKEDTVSKNDDLGLDAPISKKAAKAKAGKPAPKGKAPTAKAPRAKVNKLEGKKLAPTAKAEKLREGALRAQVVAAFRGGRMYETGVATLEKSIKASPRGAKGEALAGLLTSKVSSMVRKGFLKVV